MKCRLLICNIKQGYQTRYSTFTSTARVINIFGFGPTHRYFSLSSSLLPFHSQIWPVRGLLSVSTLSFWASCSLYQHSPVWIFDLDEPHTILSHSWFEADDLPSVQPGLRSDAISDILSIEMFTKPGLRFMHLQNLTHLSISSFPGMISKQWKRTGSYPRGQTSFRLWNSLKVNHDTVNDSVKGTSRCSSVFEKGRTYAG